MTPLLNPARRGWLATTAAVGTAALLAPCAGLRAWTQAGPTSSAGGADRGGRFVLVFLRGACDGLSALVPYSDPDYGAARPHIAVPAPDGSADTAIRLDGQFALHPALAPLHPLWQQGVLAVVPAAGLNDPTRSHFDAQYQWETGVPGSHKDSPGWLNRLSAQHGLAALGVGESNPRMLHGSQPVKLVASGRGSYSAGALERDRQREALQSLYAGQDELSKAFQQGAASRMQTAQTLRTEMTAADNQAATPALLVQDADNLGRLMRQDPRLRLGFLSAGGWDTHANQANALSANFERLAQALMRLRSHLNQPGDAIAVVSEFGRTVAENGTRGTDHGHGNALWLIGERVNGGRWHGHWSGLALANLNERRDLPVHHDFRAVLAQVLRPTLGLGDRQLADLFPGLQWDAQLDGVMRRA